MRRFPAKDFRPPPLTGDWERDRALVQSFLALQDAWNEVVEWLLSGQLDHGTQLTGLSGDDHPQYAAIAQDESIAGIWSFLAQMVEAPMVDLAVAAELTIPTTSNAFNLTGGGTITLLGPRAAGVRVLVRFASATTINHDATALVLLSGANTDYPAGAHALFYTADGTNWREAWNSIGGNAGAASYVVMALSGALSAERRLQATAPLVLADGGANGDATLSLADTAVTPGSYTHASLTVDQKGRLTAASSGAAPVTAPTRYLDGFEVRRVSGSTVRVYSGRARDTTDAATLVWAGGSLTTAAGALGVQSKTLTGTVSATAGGSAADGSGTAFLTEFGVRALSTTGNVSAVSTTLDLTAADGFSAPREIAVGDLIGSPTYGYRRVTDVVDEDTVTVAAVFLGTATGVVLNVIENALLYVANPLDGEREERRVNTIDSDIAATVTATWTYTHTAQAAQVGAAPVLLSGEPDAWYHLWAAAEADGTNVTIIASTQRTTPWLPGSRTLYRRIGPALYLTGGAWRSFLCTDRGPRRRVATPRANAGSASTTGATALDLSTLVPPTAWAAVLVLDLANSTTGASYTGSLAPRTWGTGADFARLAVGEGGTATDHNGIAATMPLLGQSAEVWVSNANATVTLDVAGWEEDAGSWEN